MPKTNELRLKLGEFEGPLDLLLHLIRTNEMDLADIKVAQITAQYLAYLHAMQTMQLDVASEYLVMAATLLNIKAQMLLPKPVAQDDDILEEQPDPRQALVEQLKIHQTYQLAATHLADLQRKRQAQYVRPKTMPPKMPATLRKNSGDVALLQQAFLALVAKQKLTAPKKTPQVTPERFPLKTEIVRINHLVKHLTKPITFEALFERHPSLEQIVTGFLAVLELTKQGKVALSQPTQLGEITLTKGASA